MCGPVSIIRICLNDICLCFCALFFLFSVSAVNQYTLREESCSCEHAICRPLILFTSSKCKVLLCVMSLTNISFFFFFSKPRYQQSLSRGTSIHLSVLIQHLSVLALFYLYPLSLIGAITSIVNYRVCVHIGLKSKEVSVSHVNTLSRMFIVH